MAIRPDIDMAAPGSGLAEGQDAYAMALVQEMQQRRAEQRQDSQLAASRQSTMYAGRFAGGGAGGGGAGGAGGRFGGSTDGQGRPVGLAAFRKPRAPAPDPLDQMRRAVQMLDLEAESQGAFKFDLRQGRMVVDPKARDRRNAAKSESNRLKSDLAMKEAQLGVRKSEKNVEQIDTEIQALKLEMDANREALRVAKAKNDFGLQNLAEDRDRAYKVKLTEAEAERTRASASAINADAATMRATTGAKKYESETARKQEELALKAKGLGLEERKVIVTERLGDARVKRMEGQAREALLRRGDTQNATYLDGIEAREAVLTKQMTALYGPDRKERLPGILDELDDLNKKRNEILDPILNVLEDIEGTVHPGASLAPPTPAPAEPTAPAAAVPPPPPGTPPGFVPVLSATTGNVGYIPPEAVEAYEASGKGTRVQMDVQPGGAPLLDEAGNPMPMSQQASSDQYAGQTVGPQPFGPGMLESARTAIETGNADSYQLAERTGASLAEAEAALRAAKGAMDAEARAHEEKFGKYDIDKTPMTAQEREWAASTLSVENPNYKPRNFLQRRLIDRDNTTEKTPSGDYYYPEDLVEARKKIPYNTKSGWADARKFSPGPGDGVLPTKAARYYRERLESASTEDVILEAQKDMGFKSRDAAFRWLVTDVYNITTSKLRDRPRTEARDAMIKRGVPRKLALLVLDKYL